MNTYNWLKDTYGMLYDNAKQDCSKLKSYFKSNGWTNDDIKMFYEDLRYGDPETYNRCVSMYPHRKQRVFQGVQNGMRRYDEWFLKNLMDSIQR